MKLLQVVILRVVETKKMQNANTQFFIERYEKYENQRLSNRYQNLCFDSCI